VNLLNLFEKLINDIKQVVELKYKLTITDFKNYLKQYLIGILLSLLAFVFFLNSILIISFLLIDLLKQSFSTSTSYLLISIGSFCISIVIALFLYYYNKRIDNE
jgi:ABC-type multidrug transport system fused ATPase/permease subunit